MALPLSPSAAPVASLAHAPAQRASGARSEGQGEAAQAPPARTSSVSTPPLRDAPLNVHARSFALDLVDDGLRFADLDPRRVNLLGVSAQWVRADALGDLAARFPPEAGPDPLARVAECRATERPVTYETRLDPPDDDPNAQPQWWATLLTPLHDERGRLWRIVGTVSPVTDRKRLEQRLDERSQRLRLLYALAARRTDAHDDRLRYALARVTETLGLDGGLIGRVEDGAYVVEFSAGDAPAPGTSMPRAHMYCDLTLQKRDVVMLHHVAASAYGDRPAHRVHGLESYLGAPLHVAGHTYGTVAFFGHDPQPGPFSEGERDFMRLLVRWIEATLETHAHRRLLSQTQDLLERSQRMAHVGGWSYDLATGRGQWTRELYRLLEVDDDFTPTRANIPTFFTEAQYEVLRETFWAKMASDGTFDAELELTTQRGRVRWMRIIGQVERNEAGAPVRMWGTVQDITESKAREIELRQAKEAAEQAERLKAAFLANVSHEIRTPLTSVIGFSEILEEEVQGAHLRRFATLIGSSGRRLLDTINSVLALSRLEAESGDLSFEAVDLAEVAREVVDLLAFRTDADAPALTLDLPDEPVACQGNRTALHRVLLNLLSNAVKFTPSDERVTLRVEPNVGAHRDLVLLVVSDTGIGMDDAFQERLFQPFSQEADQGDPARRVHEGSGLGLAITKRLVDQMHGTIAVESTKGVGSTFTVTLPQAPSG